MQAIFGAIGLGPRSLRVSGPCGFIMILTETVPLVGGI